MHLDREKETEIETVESRGREVQSHKCTTPSVGQNHFSSNYMRDYLDSHDSTVIYL